ncbi:hypothetical protein FKR81_08820 [Lentzea tibetensis]|uniref:Uncharacterized protein n=1 Tax=Lentzea tibetensis TaxID=2591470 RepID=A0A563EXJ2_9PSEU|nr:hypothetical protein [Lentzea tibetensis]TWP52430.1 hypothetical protein FKR81_08820 [Lentzea tibetensis]
MPATLLSRPAQEAHETWTDPARRCPDPARAFQDALKPLFRNGRQGNLHSTMFLIERNLKTNVDTDALRGTKLENLKVRVDESGFQVFAHVLAATREKAESIATEILGE